VNQWDGGGKIKGDRHNMRKVSYMYYESTIMKPIKAVKMGEEEGKLRKSKSGSIGSKY
jgi:hypothetical protein